MHKLLLFLIFYDFNKMCLKETVVVFFCPKTYVCWLMNTYVDDEFRLKLSMYYFIGNVFSAKFI